MKKILGLDLGTTSIGWALISTDDNNDPFDIYGIGSRIIPMSIDDATQFSTGNAITKNQDRTIKRTQRKGYDRYQLRKKTLTNELFKLNMQPDEKLIKLPVMELWQLRADAATKGKKLTLREIGRILYHLNQKRGYKHARSDEDGDKKQKDYVQNINNRFSALKEEGKTIGQHFAYELKKSGIQTEKGILYTYRIKNQVFPRKAYVEEYDQIMACQKEFYPEILTDSVIEEIRDEIIYYQRGLKSCKHLVSICDFEKRTYINKDGKTVIDGPKVAPRTSPLFQVCKIWESINNISLNNRSGKPYDILPEQKQALFVHMDNNEKLVLADLYRILGISKQDGWWGGKAIGKGLQGNTTKMQLKKALQSCKSAESLLQFNLQNMDSTLVDESTGEIVPIIDPNYQNQPLYKLWHTIYSIKEREELAIVLKKKFGIDDNETMDKLCHIDFIKPGFGNKSTKAIRKILPHLEQGKMYSEACKCAGFRHSESLTTAENQARSLLQHIPQIQKNELKQPIVEKILNQMINLVNRIIDEYGSIDEIRVELARELKQSKDERNATDKNIRKREKENANYASLIEELNVRTSKSRIQKYRLWDESEHKCFYCGQAVNLNEFLAGFDVEIEHIIPKSLLFDDSYSNKVCSCRKCNADKSNKTAYDFMKSKSEDDFAHYLHRIEKYFNENRINRVKRERLLTPIDKIPTDFIDRQLRETQYIARKSKEILQQVCRDVTATSGSVTDFVRRCWGWDEVIHDLNFERYKEAGLTEIKTFNHKDQTHDVEKIIGWNKRLDHRHHAIDALTIACTRQSFIQRLNHLNTERDAIFAEVEKQRDTWKNDYSLLEQWIRERPHFSTQKVRQEINKICISFKSGKKVASTGKRVKYVNGKKVVLQKGVIIPRGALSEESVYGKIKALDVKKSLKFIFENPELIVKQHIKLLIEKRLSKFDGDTKKALASLKKDPIYLDSDKKVLLEYATCFKDEYVLKYPVGSIKAKDVPYIVDMKLRDIIERRLKDHGNNEKEAFKDLANNPIFLDKNKLYPVKTVRCYTGLSAVEAVMYNEDKKAIGFVKPGNNHHIAIYTDKQGNKVEHSVTFWHAVERKKYGIPVVITDPLKTWDDIQEKELPQSFLKNLPFVDWTFNISFQQNEMFLLGMNEDTYRDAIISKDYNALSKYLYRVQKITTGDYFFRHHLETNLDDSASSKEMNRFYRVNSMKSLTSLNPHKIKIDLLGKMVIP